MRNETILVVEDEQNILDLIATYLKADGFVVQTARDGIAALKLARATKPNLWQVHHPGFYCRAV